MYSKYNYFYLDSNLVVHLNVNDLFISDMKTVKQILLSLNSVYAYAPFKQHNLDSLESDFINQAMNSKAIVVGDTYVSYIYDQSKDINTSTQKLAILSKHEYWFVRKHVAENPNTDLKTLVELSEDEDQYIRDSVKQNRMNRMGLLK